MSNYATSDIHNIALVGHSQSGKTTLAEAIMVAAGAIGQPGQVEKGTTLSDFTDEEKLHQHSIYSTVLNCDSEGKHIDLIDTPGSPDFVGQTLRAMAAVELVCIVVNAAAGIEPQTRRLLQRARDINVCRMIVVNKIDSPNVNLLELVEQLQEAFGSHCLPINLPADGGSRVVDCFFNNEDGETDLGPISQHHTAIVDQVVEVDEELMATYLEQGEVSPQQLHEPFEKALRTGHVLPTAFVSARHHEDPAKTVGIGELLKIFRNLAPNPDEGNPRAFLTEAGEKVEAVDDPDLPLLAHAFKVSIDRFGKMGVVRVHQGRLTKDSTVYIGDAKKPIKINHVFAVNGKNTREVEEGLPGDIRAVLKIEDVHFDSVLRGEADGPRQFAGAPFPEPMFGLAITAKKPGEEQKISDALHKILEEDPTFKVVRDAVTHETVIYGLGDQHLRIILEKMKERFHVEVDTRPPKIAYRETITAKAEGHHRHKKQTGGAGQFGEVFLRVEPLERGAGFEFEDAIVGGVIPHTFLPAIEKGVRQVLEQGAVSGNPVQDVKVTVHDGKHHAVDSKEVAFVTAGKRAFIDAITKARPAILEPMVHVEITAPNDKMGDITGDLAGKRGRIEGTDMLPGDQAIIKATVPLAEMGSYQSQLKSVTAGQGSYTMEFARYDPVPGNVQKQIIDAYKPHDEED